MNSTNYSASASSAMCFRSILPDDEYAVADYFLSLLAIVLNLLSCPPLILLNALIITAVKTKRSLQTNHNILLASLAGTDLAVGIAAQPAFIAQEIYRLTGGSPYVFCKIYSIARVTAVCLCLVSLFHLVPISVERFVAMKYPLQYEGVVSKFRLIGAVSGCWLIVMLSYVSKLAAGKVIIPAHILAVVSLLVISYCHISVYIVCRRHMNQTKSEQNSKEAKKFLAESKVWKTTGCIIGGVFICYLPGFLHALADNLLSGSYVLRISWPLVYSCYLLNSLFNPIVLLCWRSKAVRNTSMQLLRGAFDFS